MVPQAGAINDILQFQAEPGDTVSLYLPETRNYQTYTFDELDLIWYPNAPVINVGQAFFINRLVNAGQWVRNFTVQ